MTAPLSAERLAEIRASVVAAPHPAPGTWAAGLRDLLAEVDRLRALVAEPRAARPAILDLPPDRRTRRLQAEMRADVEDLHDGPLDHAYRLCRDLPAGGAS